MRAALTLAHHSSSALRSGSGAHLPPVSDLRCRERFHCRSLPHRFSMPLRTTRLEKLFHPFSALPSQRFCRLCEACLPPGFAPRPADELLYKTPASALLVALPAPPPLCNRKSLLLRCSIE